MKVFIFVLTSLVFLSRVNSQKHPWPGGVTKPSSWYSANLAGDTARFINNLHPDASLQFGKTAILNANAALLFDGSSHLTIPDATSGALTVFTAYHVSDTVGEKLIWYSKGDSKADLVLTTHRMARLSDTTYMNFIDLNRKDPKVSIYTQNGISSPLPTASAIDIGLGPKSPKLPVSDFKGQIPEIISYDRVLSAAERKRVASYLAIKYGITLSDPDGSYMNSDGNLVWKGTDYIKFHHNIAGIARDDASGLLQTVSSSSNTPNLFSVKNISSLNDKSFLLWGDNGETMQEDEQQAGMPVMLQRKWLMIPTGIQGTINTNLVFNASNMDVNLPPRQVYWLAVDSTGSGNFTAAHTRFIRMSTIDRDGMIHFDNIQWGLNAKEALSVSIGGEMLVTTDITQPDCRLQARGTFGIKIIGGKAPYHLSIQRNGRQMVSRKVEQQELPINLTDVEIGEYTLRVTDDIGLQYTDSFVTNYMDAKGAPELLKMYEKDPGGAITLDAENGMSGGYSYIWTGPASFYSSTPKVTIRDPGNYNLRISKDGCDFLQEVTIKNRPTGPFSNLLVYPNPAGGIFTVQLSLSRTAPADMNIYDESGKMVLHRFLSGKKNYNIQENIQSNGIYTLMIVSGEYKISRKIIVSR